MHDSYVSKTHTRVLQKVFKQNFSHCRIWILSVSLCASCICILHTFIVFLCLVCVSVCLSVWVLVSRIGHIRRQIQQIRNNASTEIFHKLRIIQNWLLTCCHRQLFTSHNHWNRLAIILRVTQTIKKKTNKTVVALVFFSYTVMYMTLQLQLNQFTDWWIPL